MVKPGSIHCLDVGMASPERKKALDRLAIATSAPPASAALADPVAVVDRRPDHGCRLHPQLAPPALITPPAEGLSVADSGKGPGQTEPQPPGVPSRQFWRQWRCIYLGSRCSPLVADAGRFSPLGCRGRSARTSPLV